MMLSRIFAALLLFASLMQPVSATAANSRGGTLWHEGDTVGYGWWIKSVASNPGRVLLVLAREGLTAEVEIIPAGDPALPGTVGRYRVQPAAGARVPPDLLKVLEFRLRKSVANANDSILVSIDSGNVDNLAKARSRVSGPSVLEEKPRGVFFLAMLAVSVLITLLLAAEWGKARRADSPAMAVVLLAGAASCACLIIFVPPASIPGDWISVLSEGHTSLNISQLYGDGARVGRPYREALEILIWDSASALYMTVWLNCMLACANAAIFFGVAYCITQSWLLATALSVTAILSPLNVVSAFSALPSQALFLLFMLAAVSAGYRDLPGIPRWGKALSVLQMTFVAVMIVMTRLELIILVLPVMLIVALAQFGFGRDLMAALRGRVVSALKRLSAAPMWKVTLVGVLAAAAIFSAEGIPSRLHEPSVVFRLMGSGFLDIPAFLATVLPLGLVIFILFGIIRGLHYPGRFLLVPITVLALFNLYERSSHGQYFELVRYVTYMYPCFAVLALFGWNPIREVGMRLFAFGVSWKPLTAGILTLAFLAYPVHTINRIPAKLSEPHSMIGIDKNQQREVRYLLESVVKYPSCTMVAPVIREVGDRKNRNLMFFGAGFDRATAVAYDGADLAAFVRPLLPASTECLLVYRGLDCSRIEYPSCEQLFAGMKTVDRISFASEPYSDSIEFGVLRGEIVLAFYEAIPSGQ